MPDLPPTDVPPADRVQRALVICGIACVLLSLSPMLISGMGYTAEEIATSHDVLAEIRALLDGAERAAPVRWSRNGFVEPFVKLPFVAITHLLTIDHSRWEEPVLALEPVLLSSAMAALLFVWLRAMGLSRSGASIWACAAIFTTMLWPYAYIGLETTQSAALFATAFVAIGPGRRGSWPKALLLGLLCALTVATKLAGTLLVPAMLFLVYSYFRSGEIAGRPSARRIAQLLTVVAIVVAVLVPAVVTRQEFWIGQRAFTDYFGRWIVSDPIEFALNAVALWGSPNKGLVVYAPLAVISLLLLPRAARQHRDVALFAVLVVAGLTAGAAMLRFWTDETWGPRYLHGAVAPLILLLALTLREIRIGWLARGAVCAAAFAGLFVSFLGASFQYGALHVATKSAGQSTLETIQGDPVWNHVRFNARLLRVRIDSASASPSENPWVPSHVWWFEAPPGSEPWRPVDLRPLATPQAAFIAERLYPHRDLGPLTTFVLPAILALGLIAIAAACLLAARLDRRARR